MKTIKLTADTKFHGDAPFTCVDIVFQSKDQIAKLINALQQLMIENDETEIIEIEDDNSTENPGLGAAVYFHRLGFARDALDLSCLASAEDLIMRYQNEDDDKNG